MTKRLPWWAKIVIKILISKFRIPYGFLKNLGLVELGKMNSHNYSVEVFFSHLRNWGYDKKDLQGLTILELGPGDSIATAIIASALGARAILVDTGSYVGKDISIYKDLVVYLQELGYEPKSISQCKDTQEILEKCSSELHIEGLKSLKNMKDSSIDVIFSQAVLEHIRLDEFLDTLNELKRITKKGGISSHVVDLKDHLGDSLNNLRFSKKVWESNLFSNSGFYTNRISFPKMLDYFKQARFDVKVSNIKKWEKLPIARNKLHKSFRQLPNEDLIIKGFLVTLRNTEI